MVNPRHACWLQFGLVFVTGQMTAAVQAASPVSSLPVPRTAAEVTASPFQSETLMAQIIPDSTLGDEASTVIDGRALDRIDGGAVRGSNLFHSFQEFNVDTGQQVYFVNPANIETILSRVTGSNRSAIDGLLGVEGTANLFLLNPNGLVFGPNARLDIRGAFTASTANSLEFADGTTYSAANPQENSLLTMSVPLGVQFSPLSSGDIISTGALAAGQDLTLSGHQLSLEGQLIAGENLALRAQDTVTIRDTPTVAFMARSGDALTIQGDQGIDIWTLQHLEQLPFASGGNLRLLSDGEISADAHFESGGSLQFLTLAEAPSNVVSFYDPILIANGDIIFGDYQGTALKVEATGNIQAGSIQIDGPDTTLIADGSGSDKDLLASSQAVILRAGVGAINNTNTPVTVAGTDFTTAPMAAELGSIVVGTINTANFNGGDGGPIILAAEGDISILDNIVSIGQSTTGDAGNGGNITILSTFGDISIDGRLNAFSLSSVGDARNGGDISITAGSGNVFLNNNITAFSLAERGDAGSGGNISIASETGNIVIDDGAINAFAIARRGSTLSGGNLSLSSVSGNISSNSGLNVISTARDNAGDGGNISVSSQFGDISLDSVSSISQAGTGNSSNGGDILISSQSGNVSTDRVTAFSLARGSAGNGGDITISSQSGNISADDNVTAFSLSRRGNASNGGSITISSQFGNISANGSLVALSEAREGNAGRGGSVAVSSESGNISIERVDSFSFARFDTGEGAPITISSSSGDIATENLNAFSGSFVGTASDGGDILVSSEFGDITTGDVDTSSVLTSFLDPDNNEVFPAANFTSTANGGNILLSTMSGDISIEGFVLSSSFSLKGRVSNAGDISIFAQEGNISGNNNPISALSVSRISDQTGDGGNVTLEAVSVSDLEISTISSSGASGSVIIQNIKGDLSISDLNLITSGQEVVINPVYPIQSERLVLLSSADFEQSGKTVITSAGDLTLDNVQILSDANRSAAAGDVEISGSGNIRLNNSQILSNTNVGSSGDGGSVTLIGTESVTLDQSMISTDTDGSGRAGSFRILTPQLNIQNGTTITAETSSSDRIGSGGNIGIEANEIALSGEETEISVSTSGPAAAGSITLEPFSRNGDIVVSILDEGPQLSASTAVGSQGRGGDIVLRDADIALLRNADLITSSSGSGNAGNVVIENVGVLLLRQGSLIQAGASASGDGGNIDIDAGLVITVANEDNDILADTSSGKGGDIEITAERILGFREVTTFSSDLRENNFNDISARSERGVDGEVSINNFAVDPNQGLTELPTNVADPANQIAQGCGAGAISNSPTGDFVITGRGGQLMGPADIPNTHIPLNDLGPDITDADDEASPLLTSFSSPSSLADAQEAVVTASGDVFLVTEGAWSSSVTCASLQ